MFRTSGPSPTTTSAPIEAWRMRSRPSRSPVPGATAANASSRATRWRAGMARDYFSLQTAELGCHRHRRDPDELEARGTVGGRRRHDGAGEAHAVGLVEAAAEVADLAHLAAEADL